MFCDKALVNFNAGSRMSENDFGSSCDLEDSLEIPVCTEPESKEDNDEQNRHNQANLGLAVPITNIQIDGGNENQTQLVNPKQDNEHVAHFNERSKNENETSSQCNSNRQVVERNRPGQRENQRCDGRHEPDGEEKPTLVQLREQPDGQQLKSYFKKAREGKVVQMQIDREPPDDCEKTLNKIGRESDRIVLEERMQADGKGVDASKALNFQEQNHHQLPITMMPLSPTFSDVRFLNCIILLVFFVKHFRNLILKLKKTNGLILILLKSYFYALTLKVEGVYRFACVRLSFCLSLCPFIPPSFCLSV